MAKLSRIPQNQSMVLVWEPKGCLLTGEAKTFHEQLGPLEAEPAALSLDGLLAVQALLLTFGQAVQQSWQRN